MFKVTCFSSSLILSSAASNLQLILIYFSSQCINRAFLKSSMFLCNKVITLSIFLNIWSIFFIIPVLTSLSTSFIYVISGFVSISLSLFTSHYRLYFPVSFHAGNFLLDIRHCEFYVHRSWRFLHAPEYLGLSLSYSLGYSANNIIIWNNLIWGFLSKLCKMGP